MILSLSNFLFQVLDGGKLVEFDVPHNLLQSGTIFSQLVSQTGRKTARLLRENARKHFARINERKKEREKEKEKQGLKVEETPDEDGE